MRGYLTLNPPPPAQGFLRQTAFLLPKQLTDCISIRYTRLKAAGDAKHVALTKPRVHAWLLQGRASHVMSCHRKSWQAPEHPCSGDWTCIHQCVYACTLWMAWAGCGDCSIAWEEEKFPSDCSPHVHGHATAQQGCWQILEGLWPKLTSWHITHALISPMPLPARKFEAAEKSESNNNAIQP